MTDTTKSIEKKDLVFTRVFDAPVEQVWKAWVEPEMVMQWWGPDGFTSPSAKMDCREGGTCLVWMRAQVDASKWCNSAFWCEARQSLEVSISRASFDYVVEPGFGGQDLPEAEVAT